MSKPLRIERTAESIDYGSSSELVNCREKENGNGKEGNGGERAPFHQHVFAGPRFLGNRLGVSLQHTWIALV